MPPGSPREAPRWKASKKGASTASAETKAVGVHPFEPTGGKLVDAFDFGVSHHHDAVAEALDAVGRVHGAVGVPRATVRTEGAKRSRRSGYERGGWWDSGPPGGVPDFGIYAESEHPGFDLLHELGHHIDRGVLGSFGQSGAERGSGRPHGPALDALMRAIDSTDRSRYLAELARKQRARGMVLMGNGKVVPGMLPVPPRYVDYIRKPTEAFARAYAQYVAQRSGASGLLKSLERLTSHTTGLDFKEQYSNADFSRFEGEMDRLLRELGWMRTTDRTKRHESRLEEVGRLDGADDGPIVVECSDDVIAQLTRGADGNYEASVENYMLVFGWSRHHAEFVVSLEEGADSPGA